MKVIIYYGGNTKEGVIDKKKLTRMAKTLE